MTEQATTRGVPLSNEDRARIARLYEEVTGRLEEAGMIIARTMGRDTRSDHTVRFAPGEQNGPLVTGAGPGGVDIEIVYCDENGCACYDYRDGTCGPC